MGMAEIAMGNDVVYRPMGVLRGANIEKELRKPLRFFLFKEISVPHNLFQNEIDKEISGCNGIYRWAVVDNRRIIDDMIYIFFAQREGIERTADEFVVKAFVNTIANVFYVRSSDSHCELA